MLRTRLPSHLQLEQSRKMRLLITVPDLALEAGGPARSSLRTAEAVADLGIPVALAYRDDGRARLTPGNKVCDYPITEAPTRSLRGYLSHRRGLSAAIRDFKPSLVYDFGVWLPQNIASYQATQSARLPWISSTRGMLEPWSLHHKSVKKKVAWLLYQKHMLLNAAAIITTSPGERTNVLRLLPRSEVWIIPNGVDLPASASDAHSGPRQALYLSLINAKKQPDVLVRAWARVRPSGWRLVIAGPGDAGYRQMLANMIGHLGLSSVVELKDAAYGEDKEKLFRTSHLFVLPTQSENFGNAIAEALAHGLPVITTTGTPWECLAEEGAGWWVAATETEISSALQLACNSPPETLKKMGAAGKAIAKRYSWSSTAHRLIENIESRYSQI